MIVAVPVLALILAPSSNATPDQDREFLAELKASHITFDGTAAEAGKAGQAICSLLKNATEKAVIDYVAQQNSNDMTPASAAATVHIAEHVYCPSSAV